MKELFVSARPRAWLLWWVPYGWDLGWNEIEFRRGEARERWFNVFLGPLQFAVKR